MAVLNGASPHNRGMQMHELPAELDRYRTRWPSEAATVDLFLALLAEGGEAFRRERLAGHFTASAWVVAADGARTLLTHHRKLGLWLQPGGHADGDTELPRAALKEAEEETGLPGLRIESGIFDLDRHWIPEHKGVPAHWHYDVRYVVRASSAISRQASACDSSLTTNASSAPARTT